MLKEKRINDAIALESKIEEMKYHSFWSDNKHAYGKKEGDEVFLSRILKQCFDSMKIQ